MRRDLGHLGSVRLPIYRRVSFNFSATEAQIDDIQPIKPPPRPRPGSKRFLASVLTILSKSTTGTQYPDNNDKKVKAKKKAGKDDIPAESEKARKPKFKSKILNETKNQIDNFEVLQPKKEMVQTPSLYSERSYREDIKWSDLPRLVKPENDEANESVVNNLVREVTEGRKTKEKKVKVVDPDPPTLVSEHKEDKKIYNFFVDLLETTFSVYNLKAEYAAAPIPSAVSSKIMLEMDESVARKLNVGTGTLNDVTHKPSKHFYCVQNDENRWNDDKLIDYFQPAPFSKRINELPLRSPTKRRRMKTESFAYARSKTSPQSKSAVITQSKSFYRKNKKENLLNILKEQLRMDKVSFDEPQNLYQALKVMAKNKRKTIRFDKTANMKEGYKPPECMLKRRKVISSSTKSSSKYENEYIRSTRSISHKFSEVSGYRQNATELTELSNHSLEVYGFDYEIPHKKLPEKREREILMTYHSSPSASDHDHDNFTKLVGGSSSTIRDFNEHEPF